MSIKDKLEKLKGIGVKCLSAEHGKDIIDFYHGIISTQGYEGDETGYNYGININGEFRCYRISLEGMFAQILTLDQVKELVKDKPKNFFYDEPKEMMVSPDNKEFRTRIVIAEYNTKFMTDTLGLYEYAKEIPKEEPKPEQDEQFCLIKEFLDWKKNNENK